MRSDSASVRTVRDSTRYLAISCAVVAAGLALWWLVPQKFVKLAAMGSVGALAALLALAHPKHALYFGLFYLYAGVTYYTGSAVVAAIALLVAASVALRFILGDPVRVMDPVFNWSLAIFTLIAVQSFLYAHDLSYSLASFAQFAKSVLLVFLVVQLIRTARDLETLGLVIFAGTLGTVVLGAMNIHLGIVKSTGPVAEQFGWQRLGWTHENPNVAALYLVAGVPLGVYAVKRARRAVSRILLVLGTITVVVGIIMTFSRQTIFPLSLVLLAVLFKEAKSKWVYAVAFLAVALGLFLVPEYYWYRLSSISQVLEGGGEDYSLATRAMAFKAAWRMFLHHPVTGVGLNNFIARSGSEVYVRIGAHNGYLEILTGVGLFGFIAFIMMPITAIRGFMRAVKAPWPEDLRWMKDLSYYFLWSGIAVFVSVFFEQEHFYRVYWLPIAAGLVANALGRAVEDSNKNSGTHPAFPA
jgi:O-antigen ligase